MRILRNYFDHLLWYMTITVLLVFSLLFINLNMKGPNKRFEFEKKLKYQPLNAEKDDFDLRAACDATVCLLKIDNRSSFLKSSLYLFEKI